MCVNQEEIQTKEHTDMCLVTSYDTITLFFKTYAFRLAIYAEVWKTARYIAVMSKVSWSTP